MQKFLQAYWLSLRGQRQGSVFPFFHPTQCGSLVTPSLLVWQLHLYAYRAFPESESGFSAAQLDAITCGLLARWGQTQFSCAPHVSLSLLNHPGPFNLIKNIVHCRSSRLYDYLFFPEHLFISPGLKCANGRLICMACAAPSSVSLIRPVRTLTDGSSQMGGGLNSHLCFLHWFNSWGRGLVLSILTGGRK